MSFLRGMLGIMEVCVVRACEVCCGASLGSFLGHVSIVLTACWVCVRVMRGNSIGNCLKLKCGETCIWDGFFIQIRHNFRQIFKISLLLLCTLKIPVVKSST